MSDSARERILSRVRAAVALRSRAALPDLLESAAPDALTGDALIRRFAERFAAAGGDAVVHATLDEASRWAGAWYRDFSSVSTSAWVPAGLRPSVEESPPDEVGLAVSLAVGAAADTGTLLLDSREGRRLQLLAPVHLVWVPRGAVWPSLEAALDAVRGHRGAALGLHSGPSKSADIGGELVRGVHGPGRVVAAIVPVPTAPPSAPSAPARRSSSRWS